MALLHDFDYLVLSFLKNVLFKCIMSPNILLLLNLCVNSWLDVAFETVCFSNNQKFSTAISYGDDEKSTREYSAP